VDPIGMKYVSNPMQLLSTETTNF